MYVLYKHGKVLPLEPWERFNVSKSPISLLLGHIVVGWLDVHSTLLQLHGDAPGVGKGMSCHNQGNQKPGQKLECWELVIQSIGLHTGFTRPAPADIPAISCISPSVANMAGIPVCQPRVPEYFFLPWHSMFVSWYGCYLVFINASI